MTTDTIMLVESEPVFARILRRWLDSGGYDVTVATNAAEALALATQHAVGVAIISLDLPARQGDALVSALSEASPTTECLLLSVEPDIARLAPLYDCGNVFGHRWKPLEDMADLARDIGRALERRSLRRQNAYLLIELRDARDELRSQAEFLVQTERLAALGHLAVGLAEELRAPISTFGAYAGYLGQALGREREDAGRRQIVTEYLAEMRRTADRALSLLEATVEFGRGQETHGGGVDLGMLVCEALALLRYTLEQRGIALRIDVPASGPEIAGSHVRLRQAITHIVLNAAHAMPAGGDLVVRVLGPREEAHDAVVVVTDSGTGISPDIIARVFEPFFTTQRHGYGTGLGLSVTRDIVRGHDGEISIESAPGQGTTVTMRFPLLAVFAESPAGVTRAA